MNFQPIVDTVRGTVVGYESLARFRGPPDAPPDRWFARARAAGVGAELEARALSTAFEARGALPPELLPVGQRRPGGAGLGAGRGGVRRGRATCAASSSRSPSRAAVADYDALLSALAPVRAAGALLAVDDAGAGFASLKHITCLRPDFVKVDRDLVAGIDADETKAAVLAAGRRPSRGSRSWTSTTGRWRSPGGTVPPTGRSACCPRSGWRTWRAASPPARRASAASRWRCATSEPASSGS
jgi:hypothetical protein